jgi:hypothetical protein
MIYQRRNSKPQEMENNAGGSIFRLKRVVKNIHSDFQEVPIIVLASKQSSAELLMTNADMQASQDARIGNLVENASSLM